MFTSPLKVTRKIIKLEYLECIHLLEAVYLTAVPEPLQRLQVLHRTHINALTSGSCQDNYSLTVLSLANKMEVDN